MISQLRKAHFAQRSRVDILACILKNCVKSARKTHVIQRCRLSDKQFRTYERFLVDENGLVEKRISKGEGTIYRITRRGKNILAVLERLLEPINLIRKIKAQN